MAIDSKQSYKIKLINFLLASPATNVDFCSQQKIVLASDNPLNIPPLL